MTQLTLTAMDVNIDSLVEEAAETALAPIADDGALTTVANLAMQLRAERDVVDSLESALKEHKAKIRELEEEALPAAMLVANLMKFTTQSGVTVEVFKFTSARITADKKADALAWLRANGHDSLIKQEISVAFARGKDSLAAEAQRALEALGCEVSREETVHFKTLEKFVKEMHEDGQEVPRDLFGVFVGRRATIK